MRLCYPTISEEIRVALPESFTSIEACPFGAFTGLFPSKFLKYFTTLEGNISTAVNSLL